MIQNQNFSSLGKLTQLTGSFTFHGQTHLLGKLTGDITISQAKLVLEIGSFTEAVIHCHEIEIYGEFSGEIHSDGLVVLYPTAIVSGKILAKSLEIFPGAIVNMNGHAGENLT